jgi:hypothetical protein
MVMRLRQRCPFIVIEGVSDLHALPDMGQDEPWGADELRSPYLPGGQSDHPHGGVGERRARLDGGPAEHGRALQSEEDQDAAEEAFDASPFAQLLGSLGRWQPISPLLPLRIPRDHCCRAQGRMDPRDERESPVAGIQANASWTDLEEATGMLQQWTGKGTIMDVGR